MLKVFLSEVQELIADPQLFRVGLELILVVLTAYIAIKIRGFCQQFYTLVRQVNKLITIVGLLPAVPREVALWLENPEKNGGDMPGDTRIECQGLKKLISDFTIKH